MIALVRPVSKAFAHALVQDPTGCRPDPDRARAEHEAYVDALARLVDAVIEVPADDEAPDACFVEDTVVVAGGRALITRPGAPSRRGEVDAVAAALPAHLEVHRMRAPATLDGGDVLRVGRTLFVGRSGRTDAAGVEALRQVFGPVGYKVVEVSVRDALHLKCHASAVSDEVVLLAEGFADPALFDGVARVLTVHPDDAYAANIVAVGARVLVADGFPRVVDLLNSHGFDPMTVPVGEIARADGSLTCLSVLVSEAEDSRWPSVHP